MLRLVDRVVVNWRLFNKNFHPGGWTKALIRKRKWAALRPSVGKTLQANASLTDFLRAVARAIFTGPIKPGWQEARQRHPNGGSRGRGLAGQMSRMEAQWCLWMGAIFLFHGRRL
jgi:hypothetical protein